MTFANLSEKKYCLFTDKYPLHKVPYDLPAKIIFFTFLACIASLPLPPKIFCIPAVQNKVWRTDRSGEKASKFCFPPTLSQGQNAENICWFIQERLQQRLDFSKKMEKDSACISTNNMPAPRATCMESMNHYRNLQNMEITITIER